MKYYVPIGDRRYLCIENGKTSRVVIGDPDPFSRVTCPRVIWKRVEEDLPYLTKAELSRAKRARYAFTRLHEGGD